MMDVMSEWLMGQWWWVISSHMVWWVGQNIKVGEKVGEENLGANGAGLGGEKEKLEIAEGEDVPEQEKTQKQGELK